MCVCGGERTNESVYQREEIQTVSDRKEMLMHS